jgi:hypothetical protein
MATATNTIVFISQDAQDRDIIFMSNPDMEAIPTTTVPGGQNVTVEFPFGWTGNYYAVEAGSAPVTGMLGEVSWNSWGDLTFFDVSAIVNASDVNGVKMMWPESGSPSSGCGLFPCANAYYVWNDDVQTKATSDDTIYCTLGGNSQADATNVVERSLAEADEDSPSFARDFVLGKWSSKAKRN